MKWENRLCHLKQRTLEMTDTPDILQTQQFLAAIHKFELPGYVEHKLSDLKKENSNCWASWEKKAGVYIFFQNGKVQYVGRAFPSTGLGGRIFCQITSFGDPLWDVVIKETDGEVTIGLIPFENDTSFIASALEAYLIEKLSPERNKRCQ
jgi:hypothetical protein